MGNKAGAIPLSMDLVMQVKQRQLELSNEKGKIITLTEVSNEIVRNGLEIKKENKKEKINDNK